MHPRGNSPCPDTYPDGGLHHVAGWPERPATTHSAAVPCRNTAHTNSHTELRTPTHTQHCSHQHTHSTAHTNTQTSPRTPTHSTASPSVGYTASHVVRGYSRTPPHRRSHHHRHAGHLSSGGGARWTFAPRQITTTGQCVVTRVGLLPRDSNFPLQRRRSVSGK